MSCFFEKKYIFLSLIIIITKSLGVSINWRPVRNPQYPWQPWVLRAGIYGCRVKKNWKIELVWVVSGGLGFEKWKPVVSIPARDTLVLESHITVLHTAQAPALLPLPLLHGKVKSNYLFLEYTSSPTLLYYYSYYYF